MNMNNSMICRWLGCAALSFGTAALAISPAEVQQKLSAGEKLTLVDVRPTALFKQGHIPNAVNMPATVVPQKQLPPLGRVIVYDEGLGPDAASPAVAALNQKPGIAAEVLEGGFAAWETSRCPTTRPRGMKSEGLPMITYDRLKRVPAEDLVLVDLRAAPSGTGVAKDLAQAAAPALTDLQAEFPNVRVTRSPFETGTPKTAGLAAAPGSRPSLFVLVDSGNGAAQQMARALKANGIQRFAILVGGEEILARKGRPGQSRIAAPITTPRTPAPSQTTTNR